MVDSGLHEDAETHSVSSGCSTLSVDAPSIDSTTLESTTSSPSPPPPQPAPVKASPGLTKSAPAAWVVPTSHRRRRRRTRARRRTPGQARAPAATIPGHLPVGHPLSACARAAS